MAYGEFIRGIREMWERNNRVPAKESRRRFAKAIGVRYETLIRWEGDQQPPNHEHLERMLDLIKLDLSDCLFLPDQLAKRDEMYRDFLLPLIREAIREELTSAGRSPPSTKKSGS